MEKTLYEQYLRDCPDLIKKYLFYTSTIRGKENLTVKTYFFDLKNFFLYILDFKNVISINSNELTPSEEIQLLNNLTVDILNDITQQDILQYLYYCKNELNLSTSTRSKHLSAIKGYFKYMCNTEKVINNNPTLNIENPKKPTNLPVYLTLEDAQKLLENIDGQNYKRDYCIITLFLNCGLRLSELVSINIDDLRSDNTLKFRGKGNKERIIYLNNACLQAIKDYLELRLSQENVIDKEALFISKNRVRLTPRGVEYVVDKSLKNAGLKGYSTHKLRHTAATLMYQSGTDVRTLQELLGHSNLSTTQIYTHINEKQVQDAVNNNPLNNVKTKQHNS
jgi:site-specific recombinase XerD